MEVVMTFNVKTTSEKFEQIELVFRIGLWGQGYITFLVTYPQIPSSHFFGFFCHTSRVVNNNATSKDVVNDMERPLRLLHSISLFQRTMAPSVPICQIFFSRCYMNYNF